MGVLFWSTLIVFVTFWSSFDALSDDDIHDTEYMSPLRILYNIGNMANDISQADEFLRDGANSLEIDVRFQKNGVPNRIYHGVPCDCFRDCRRSAQIADYFEHMRIKSTPGTDLYVDRLSLLVLDLHLGDVDNHDDPLFAAGDAIAQLIMNKIYQNGTSGSKLWILIGIPKISQAASLRGFRDAFRRLNQSQLLQKIGYEVNEEENMDSIQQMFRGMDIGDHIWQGDGITNCVAGRSDIRLRQAIAKRDSPSGPWINVDKVYRWTIDTKTAMKHSLRLGVDGIMTNDPDDVIRVLESPEFASKFRLAMNSDNPFDKIQGPGPLRYGCTRNSCWKDCTYSGRWCWTGRSGCKADPSVCSLALGCTGQCGTSK